MRRVTSLLMLAAFVFAGNAYSQSTDYSFVVERSADAQAAYPADHSGVRTVAGPFDLDGDGLQEVLVSDYTGGGRVHVLEVVGPDTWEWVYSTPWLDDTKLTTNQRVITGGDLDGDGHGEIIFMSGCKSFTGSGQHCDTDQKFDNAAYPQGIYVFEHTGADNDYGAEPTTIYQMPNAPDRNYPEQMTAADIDGDGSQELFFGVNGRSSIWDNWYIVSVTGDIGSGFETWNEEALISSRNNDWDPVYRGGGSPYGMVAADLDGNGITELVMSSWNNLNVTLGQIIGADTYGFPDGSLGPNYAQMSSSDHVALFGLDVIDINNDGTDEVYGTNLYTGDVFVVNYESGEPTYIITEDNYELTAIPGLSALGLTAGDLDNDGNMDLIGSGVLFSSSRFNAGEDPNWVNIVEFIGGQGADPEDPANYSEITEVYFPNDRTDAFDKVTRDSAGVITQYREDGTTGPQFASKFAFLGDVDGDGENEVALGFQGQNDSLYTFTEVYNPADSTYTRTLVSSEANPVRVFMRVLSSSVKGVAIEDERVIIPNDYVLEQNYPNPFNPTTNIRFELPRDKAVSLTIFDVSGRVVARLVDNQYLSQGVHEFQWDGTSDAGGQVASGTYMYQLKFGNFAHTKTMVLLK
ncbi:MAG: FlgD immunoglobulin-like domain containing protein [Rhodothermales bacterium]